MEKQVEPLFTKAEWDFEKIKEVCDACEEIAVKELGLDYFPIQIEIVTSEQMIDAYASTGLPIYYAHWSLVLWKQQNRTKRARCTWRTNWSSTLIPVWCIAWNKTQ